MPTIWQFGIENSQADNAVLEVARRFSALDWVNQDFIDGICGERKMIMRTARSHVTGNDVRALKCAVKQGTQRNQIVVSAIVHSRYKSLWYTASATFESGEGLVDHKCCCAQSCVTCFVALTDHI
jgi:hypothetical protein